LEIDDQTLIMADLSRKAIQQVQRFVRTLLKDAIPQPKIQPENIESIIEADDRTSYPRLSITVEEAQKWAANLRGLPDSIYKLMEFYPQPQGTSQRAVHSHAL